MQTQTLTAAERVQQGKRITAAQLEHLENIIETGKTVKRIRAELAAHDARRDRFRRTIVDRLQVAEARLTALTAQTVRS